MIDLTLSICSNAHYAPHSHDGRTYHLITKGEMTVWFPNEQDTSKKVFGVGSRCDVEPGRVHEVVIGDEGCTMVIGE